MYIFLWLKKHAVGRIWPWVRFVPPATGGRLLGNSWAQSFQEDASGCKDQADGKQGRERQGDCLEAGGLCGILAWTCASQLWLHITGTRGMSKLPNARPHSKPIHLNLWEWDSGTSALYSCLVIPWIQEGSHMGNFPRCMAL